MTGGHGDSGKKQMAPPPDGGWGWPVTIASFLIHLILDGITYSFGVFVVGLIDTFEATRQEAGWVGSIMIGVTYSAGPIASVLCSRFGCRLVTVTGSLIAAIGLVLSIFCPTIQLMYITFGLITGFGLGMTYLPAIVCVAYYFDQKRSLAIGIACCGSGVGTFIFGRFAGFLLEEFGWRGGMLIEAGLVLNCCAFGLIFIEPTLPANKIKVPQGTEMKDMQPVEGASKKPTDDQDVVVNGKKNGQVSSSLDKDRSASVHSLPHDKKSASSFAKNRSEEALPMIGNDEEGKVLSKEAKKDLSRSVLNLPNYRSNPNLVTAPNENVATDKTDDAKGDESEAQEKKGTLAAIRETLSSLMDFSLLCDGLFLMFGISNFLTSVGYLVPYIFLPDRANQMGMTEKQGSTLITVVGGANTIGRVVFGFLSDFLSTNVYFNRTLLYCTALTIVGILTSLSIFCLDFWSLAIYAALFGFLMGVYVLLTSVVLVDLLSVEKLSNSFGLVLLFQGIASVIGPPIAGAMFDMTGGYDIPFLINGLLVAISGAMLYLYFLMPSYRARAKEVAAEARKKKKEKKEAKNEPDNVVV